MPLLGAKRGGRRDRLSLHFLQEFLRPARDLRPFRAAAGVQGALQEVCMRWYGEAGEGGGRRASGKGAPARPGRPGNWRTRGRVGPTRTQARWCWPEDPEVGASAWAWRGAGRDRGDGDGVLGTHFRTWEAAGSRDGGYLEPALNSCLLSLQLLASGIFRPDWYDFLRHDVLVLS